MKVSHESKAIYIILFIARGSPLCSQRSISSSVETLSPENAGHDVVTWT